MGTRKDRVGAQEAIGADVRTEVLTCAPLADFAINLIWQGYGRRCLRYYFPRNGEANNRTSSA